MKSFTRQTELEIQSHEIENVGGLVVCPNGVAIASS